MTDLEPGPDPGSLKRQVQQIQALRGVRASVFLCFLFSGRPLSLKEVCQRTGYTSKSVSKALNDLEEIDLIEDLGDRIWSLRPGYHSYLVSLIRYLDQGSQPTAGIVNLPATDHEPVRAVKPGPNGLPSPEDVKSEGSSAPDGRPPTGRAETDKPAYFTPADLESKGQEYTVPSSQNQEEFLRRIGVHHTIVKRFRGRPDLQAEPSLTKAWYWFYLTQNWARNPVALMVGSIADGIEPPAAYLALARLWPEIRQPDRQEMREMAWFATSPAQMSYALCGIYPKLTAQVCAAFLDLYRAAPQELDFLE